MKPGSPVIILEGFQNNLRRCKVVYTTATGGVLGETSNGLRFFAPGPDRYIVPTLFSRIMPWER